MENKQTAVEWLVDEIEKHYIINNGSLNPTVIMELKRQAKEMEREQIDDAIDFGFIDDGDFRGIDYFYELRFNGGKNICPDCKQGILRLDRPGKMGCSVC